MNNIPEAILSSPQLPAGSGYSDEWLLAVCGRTFHFASRFLPPNIRCEVITLYAFFRTLDDLVDVPAEGRCVEDIRRELNGWRKWFTGGRSFPAPREPLGSRLSAVLDEHNVPISIFIDFLEGMFSDLEPQEMHNFTELHCYCYRVAGTVGLAMTHVMGANSVQAQVAARNLGIGMQLTNILRDVGGDLALGRIYLPQDDLARFECSTAHLALLFKAQQGPDEHFRAFMRYQIARARNYYAYGMSGIWLLPPDCRLSILVASRLYRRILAVIENKDYDVLRSRASTPFHEKVREAAIAFTLDRLWSREEVGPIAEPEVLFEC
jgi:phytoene synthase